MEKYHRDTHERHAQKGNRTQVIAILAFSLLFVACIPLRAQGVHESINRAIILYDGGNFGEAIDVLESVLEDTTLALDDEISSRTYLAFSYVACGERAQAKEQFVTILRKQEGFSLNPEFVSPKIIEVFKEAEKMVKEPETNNIISIKKVPSTTECLVKSSLFPGWGQHSRGEGKKGKFLMGAFSVSLAAFTLSHLAYLSAESSYMNAETSSDIEYQYSRYNFAYKARYVMAETSILIWVYAITDIFLTDVPEESK
jgi:hypothetical protein